MATNLAVPTRHMSVFAVPLVVVALLAAACSHSSPAPGVANVGSSTGSGGSPHAGGTSTSVSAVAYSACMRSHGVSNFPDPGSNGQVPKTDAQRLGVGSSQLRAAQQACQQLYQTSSLEQCSESGVCSPADRQELLNRMREFAQCMRSHGVPDFPDATTGPDGDPYFNLLHLHGVNPRSQTFEHKSQQCFPTLGGINIHVARP
jgi:hypothetical protein